MFIWKVYWKILDFCIELHVIDKIYSYYLPPLSFLTFSPTLPSRSAPSTTISQYPFYSYHLVVPLLLLPSRSASSSPTIS